MKLYTNHHYYPLYYFFELPEKWQTVAKKEFDWDKNLEDESQMFIYRRQLYHLANFEVFGLPWNPKDNMPDEFKAWAAYSPDSFFSGILIRYARDENGNYDSDYIQVATYIG